MIFARKPSCKFKFESDALKCFVWLTYFKLFNMQGPISFIFYKRRLLLGKKDKVDMERGVGKKKQEPPVFWSSFLFGLVRLVDFSSQAHSTTTLLLQPKLWGMKKNGFHFSLSRFLHLLLFLSRLSSTVEDPPKTAARRFRKINVSSNQRRSILVPTYSFFRICSSLNALNGNMCIKVLSPQKIGDSWIINLAM